MRRRDFITLMGRAADDVISADGGNLRVQPQKLPKRVEANDRGLAGPKTQRPRYPLPLMAHLGSASDGTSVSAG